MQINQLVIQLFAKKKKKAKKKRKKKSEKGNFTEGDIAEDHAIWCLWLKKKKESDSLYEQQ